MAKEIERIHRAGRRWRDFAVLYRAHNHRDALVTELSQRKIPFVISRLSILEHPLVKDLIAYLRLIAKPYDDIAAARVLAAPAWRLTPSDLVRYAERARKSRKKIYDELQNQAGKPAVRTCGQRLDGAAEFLVRAAQDHAAAHGSRNSRRPSRMAGNLRARFGARPRLREAPARIRESLGTEERDARLAGVRRIPRVFRPGRRHHFPGRRCARATPCN